MIELTSINSKLNLNNGTQIPCVGYGTFRTPADVAEKAVADAIKVGYRHIDTAAVYGNEEAVGKGIKDSGIDRKDLFVTSKLWNDNRGYDSTKKAFQETLDHLQMDYLDLYLIHWPANQKQFGTKASEINAETWRAMEDLYNEGKIKAIGLSNFMPHHIVELMKTAKVAPAVDQIEVHPGWPHTEQVKYLQAHNILVEAWAPLGGQGAHVMTNQTILQIADKYGKTAAQVCLRWIIQQGIVPLPKSVHENRMIQNKEIFDFVLTDDEMKQISLLTNLGGQCADPDEADF
ncbi:aldo/keto reductase [Limosilactobacillus fastidiosus]|uniref:Aldo/keto reductase n=1 Tax=Limosilactobacillus fastidiosus TaxID=2759855 RepID=A0A7W3TYE9_9LACO|nr:aldo/keto reductase [Limosilactobacillus fastidiosus]MBB1062465.1 aldo/keto reductase [Limosilactobacillus fastidiosus]MBB1085584.1 aldo/keto reductase [Limosilactobacillus fastidiosus]MCD7083539.1 aldo/keto reductase [Limosilactobacillus fastidiosus]MCD7086037.1 aldo/keto reductase [Limosilactobacillus fastidiosus]MCD7114319.1 aldo/keto reductase [Limosilactobacillus fastidiosus]